MTANNACYIVSLQGTGQLWLMPAMVCEDVKIQPCIAENGNNQMTDKHIYTTHKCPQENCISAACTLSNKIEISCEMYAVENNCKCCLNIYSKISELLE